MEELGQRPTRTNPGHKLGAHLAAIPAELGDQTLQWPALAPEVNHDMAICANHGQVLELDGASFFGRFAKRLEVMHLSVAFT
jgi:hypothetical protein